MPLHKKKSGWYWGSKGPFDTKAKALSVARAAYANGYKGENNLLITFDLMYTSEKRVQNIKKNIHKPK
jgi:hypothetical protein